MTEFVKVMFPDRRGVTIDGGANGFTNKLLQIDAGFHSFGLAGNPDYAPASIEQDVTGTTPSSPLLLQFLPVAASAVILASGSSPLALAPPKKKAPAKKASAKKKAPAKKKSPAKKAPAKKKALAKKTTATAKKKTSKKATSTRKSSKKAAKGRGR